MLELAREADWEAVQRLSRQIHDQHVAWRPDIFAATDAPLPYASFLTAIQERRIYVAKLQGVVIGYVALDYLDKKGPGVVPKRLMRLESICVEERLRGQGIGKEMVGDVRALARAFRCDGLILSVHPENDHAVGFYQKCGFRIRTIQMDMHF